MTLPTNIIFPIHTQRILSGEPEELNRYIQELIFTLQRMYEDIVESVNGDFQLFTPNLFGTTSAGAGTYTHQEGWYLRQGLMTDIWFDILWTAHTGTGNLYLELPFEVIDSNQMPFVGVLQPSSIAYTGGTELVINAIPDTFRGEIWFTGNGVATGNQLVTATGRLIGHIRYIGVEDERV